MSRKIFMAKVNIHGVGERVSGAKRQALIWPAVGRTVPREATCWAAMILGTRREEPALVVLV
jgi:hypothetical protein